LPAVLSRGPHLTRLLALLALTATLVLAAGCGSDDDEGDSGQAKTEQTTETQPPQTGAETETEPETTEESSPPADAKDPEGAFLSFQNALADGDAGTVCGLLTPSAVKQAEEASIGGKCDTWVEELSGVYDPKSKEKVKNTKVDSVEEKGDKATIKYTSPILDLPLEVEMEKSGDGWKISKLAEGV
jgi:hypothetical protein